MSGTANLEAIEVVKGPVAMLYGRVEPGGLIDMVVKRPLETPYHSLLQQGGSFGVARTTLDATGPLTADMSWLYRVNAEFLNNPSFMDHVQDQRWFGSATVTYHPTRDFRLNLDAEYQDSRSSTSIPTFRRSAIMLRQSRSAVISPTQHHGAKPDAQHAAVRRLRLDYDLDANWSVVNRFAYSNTRDIQSSMFLVCTNTPPFPNPNPFCAAGSPYGQSTVSLNWGPSSLRTISGNLE